MDKQQRAEDYSKLKVDESKLFTREVYSWSAKDSEKQYFPVFAFLAGTKFFESKVRQIWSILTPTDFGTRSLTHESSEMCYYIGMRPLSHFAAAVNYSLNERFTGP